MTRHDNGNGARTDSSTLMLMTSAQTTVLSSFFLVMFEKQSEGSPFGWS